MKKLVSWLLAASLLCSGAVAGAVPQAAQTADSPPAAQEQTNGVPLYSAYLEAHAGAARPSSVFTVEAAAAEYPEGGTPRVETLDGEKALITGETDTAAWHFTAPETGLYDVQFRYYPVGGKGSTIERSLYLDGQLPFAEARTILFNRLWDNKGEEKLYSASGNEFRRQQEECPAWTDTGLASSVGYNDARMQLYLTAGEHTLTLKAEGEPLALASITFGPAPQVKTYAERLAEWEAAGYAAVDAAVQPLIVEGEDASRKSSGTLYAVEDRTSPINQPFDEAKILLNTIGGNNWKYKHQWIEWTVKVTEPGLYRLSMRCKQDYVSGGTAFRTLTVDGELPFAEAADLPVAYSLKWNMMTMGGDEPYLLYLPAGEHTLRLTVSIDPAMSGVLEAVNESIQSLNALYRRVRMITGAFPDTHRDYNLEGSIPDLFAVIRDNIDRLNQANDALIAISGNKGEQSMYIDMVVVQLEGFLHNPDSITDRISTLSDNLNSLASWISSASQVPLLIDYLYLSSPAAPLPEAEAGFFAGVWSDVKAFFLSFITDYYSIEGYADTADAAGSVTLWLDSGRDQATAIKTLADNYFTPEYNIALNVRLVAGDVLLRAVASGTGPDVAVFQGQAKPVEYGLRGALYDLNQFDDIDEVAARFAPSAMTSQSFGGKLYGLPEQQTFLMMFTRTDVLGELGLNTPNTWDDLYAMIPILQENGLNIGLPSPTGVQSGSLSTDLNTLYAALLLQSGGAVYTPDGSRSALGSLEGVDAFIRWTEFYTKYNAPKSYSPINRFRTGETPVLFSAYTFYNTLVVAAPEIQGMWAVSPVPGTMRADGTVDRTVSCTVTSAVLFRNAKDVDASWEFMKWWTSADGQTAYAGEIEALQGESARWATANLEAMQQIPWKTSMSVPLQAQWEWVVGIEEVPGSYYVGRTVDNAIKSVINSGKSPRDTLLDAVDAINEEMINKRNEFGLE